MKWYGVKNENTNKFHRVGKVPQFFDDKEEAKKKRRELNGEDKNKDENFNTGWRVATQEKV